ncbi:leucine--tRNA ligase [Aureibaculum marinum]|uniref:Leucine--tRNA ligase n=2 Tax=Pseudomonadati TaxID=3379134 RepID=A0A3N4NR76_9FLAO|nr:class I tRNA ligase family protein [Aureibaculum marinum]RPD94610.1 leucine--tRNA ligase [Aureibaculum marinum]
MSYHFNEIEAKWQKYWAENQTFKAANPGEEGAEKPKYYVLDMFPYPSGAGLHVGHPLGYIASDIYARYKRHKGFNVMHPQGYDSFGLPAEQYAIQTGQHPAVTTAENIKTYRRQLDKIGFSFDWSREVRTSDPSYYKWTQWIFIQLFNSWYNKDTDKAEDISSLIAIFEKEGNINVNAEADDDVEQFSAEQWNAFSDEKQQKILLQYRLTFLSETEVNWCPALGTVLANDEIVNGVSERGGHPVERKKMKQWSMRISAYAQRLLDGLDKLDWPQPLKDSQTNWIGRSEGAMVSFAVIDGGNLPKINVFTTRPDTIFGVSFMTLAPEHELVSKITTEAQKEEVEAYVKATAKRSELDRMADVKTISGAFTGAYAEHPFTKEPIPIWIGDYVLAGYGTGAVMSVPCGDQRDYNFAKHFNIPIPNIFEGVDISKEAFTDKENTVITNSDFLNGLSYKKAMKTVIYEMEKRGFGYKKVNYRMRDAVFSRQRYWGEPFPVYYVDGLPQMIDEKYLPIKLPEVEKYLPTEDGKPPLGNAEVWAWCTETNQVVSNDKINNTTVFPLELNTMPGWAGSSQYFNRYMDPNNANEIFSQEAINYWQDVDLYIGGSEHATGHLLYSRFWQKFMFDKGLVPQDEFAKKLINQGMILGTSAFVYRVEWFYTRSVWGENNPEKVKKLPRKSELPDIYVSKSIFENIGRFYANYQNSDNSFLRQIDKKISELEKEYKIFESEGIGTISRSNNLAISPIHVDVSLVNSSDELDVKAFKKARIEYKNSKLLLEDGKYIVGREVEKMSKSKYNVVNPDAICEQYGADSLRLYEMFLGPLEQSKPWNTAGITGVHGFLKKLWKLYHTGKDGAFLVSENEPAAESFKTLHKTIKKVEEDIENFSFNTSVSTFMIAVNELTSQKCTSRAVLEPLIILISPYAPHIAEELWSKLGYNESISSAPFPKFEEKYLVESTKTYPISFNGKMRFTMELSLDLSKDEIEAAVMAHEKTKAQLAGRTPKKVIIVPGKIVNIVG